MPDYSLEEKKKISINHRVLFTLLAGAFAIGIFVGTAVSMFTPLPSGKGDTAPVRTEGTFKFLRTSQDPKSSAVAPANKELPPFKYKVTALVQNAREKHEASSVSVYFRDLSTGSRFSINGGEKFLTKNHWKLPLMIAYFKWAESNPLVLRKTITYNKTEHGAEPDHDRPVKEITPGKSYTVNDLIYRMIVNDDAAAYASLYANLPANRLERIFKDLDVEYDPNKKEEALSLNSFSTFYRVLYNASYLSEEMSEKALRYISQSSVREGMASGIPPNTDIACKQGIIATAADEAGQKQPVYQVYEFGIVYHARRPFLLGVLAQGGDTDKMVKIIRDITRLSYDEVDQPS
jgi:beta-lactamase class A